MLTLILSLQFIGGVLPSVPGYLNPAVTQANIHQTICKSGWTATIRPPVSYTNKLKLEQMEAGHLKGKPSDFELDHEVSLELGGHPTDPRNLWPEPYKPEPGARKKDQVEDFLHREVCAGRMPLRDAQQLIMSDWTKIVIKKGK
jgi:hypothetical protein